MVRMYAATCVLRIYIIIIATPVTELSVYYCTSGYIIGRAS